jgi:hypothetical protein
MNVDARPVLVEGSPSPWPLAEIVRAVHEGRIAPATRVSIDGGREWMHAGMLVQRADARGDDGLALLIPVGRTEGWSIAAGYVGIFSLLFFGGPLCFAGGVGLTGSGRMTILARLAFFVVPLLLGPLPPALMASAGLRAIRRDPTYRGKGRAIFALVTAALMVVASAAGAAVGATTGG